MNWMKRRRDLLLVAARQAHDIAEDEYRMRRVPSQEINKWRQQACVYYTWYRRAMNK